jgi:hypothetical protein
VIAHNKGIILGGDNAVMFTYEFSTEENFTYKLIKKIGEEEAKDSGVHIGNITSVALATTNDEVYFVMDNNQIMQVEVELDRTIVEEQ